MTAGEHSERGYDRDDSDHGSYYPPSGSDDAPAWRGQQEWPSPQPWPGQQDWPAPHEAAPAQEWTPPPPGWPSQQEWTSQQEWPPAGGNVAGYTTGQQAGGYGPGEQPGSYEYGDQYGGSGDQSGWHASGAPGYGEPSEQYHPPHDAFQPETWPGGDRTSGWQRSAAESDSNSGDDVVRGRRRGNGRRRGLPLWQELPLLLIIAFCLALLVRTFLLQAFFIPSGSMEETLLAGDRVLVNKVVYQAREPARGEVVVFRGTDAWSQQHAIDSDIGMFSRVSRALGDLVGVSRPTEKDYIKRIVGLPGDRVSCCDVEGRIFVNGQPLNEDYLSFDAPLNDAPEGTHDCRSRRFDEVVVEPGQMFVMGDHRAVSQDSRCQGQVPIDNVIGRAFVIVWPSARWASLSAPDTFDSVPQATGQQGEPAEVLAEAPADPALMVPLLLTAALTFRPRRCVPDDAGERDAVSSRSD